MKTQRWKMAVMALAVPSLVASAAPAMAVPFAGASVSAVPLAVEAANHGDRGRHEGWSRGRGHHRHYDDRGYRGEPVYAHTRIWRGGDGRYYCRKDNGTTGLLVGAAVGGVIGHEVAGYGDRTLGAILGAAGGAILGRAIDRSNTRCR